MYLRPELLSISILTLALCAIGGADAAPTATNNQCWGNITSQFAQTGLVGQHSRAKDPLFRPESQPRDGVGNVSKDGFGPVSEGGQGDHAIAVGALLGLSCNSTPGAPGAAKTP
jgi:hypothetical protein